MECIICYETITEDNKYQTPCNHVFCDHCIIKWMEVYRICPLCRNPIESKKIKYQINMFYQVFHKGSKLRFQGKLVAIDHLNYGVRYTFREISHSSRPMPDVFWSFNNMANITPIVNF